MNLNTFSCFTLKIFLRDVRNIVGRVERLFVVIIIIDTIAVHETLVRKMVKQFRAHSMELLQSTYVMSAFNSFKIASILPVSNL